MAKNENTAELEIIVAAQKSQIHKMGIRIQQIQEAAQNKEEHMKAEIARYRHIEESARNLCVKILGKDRGEMVLGVDYTWNKVETEDLIADALKSYRKYCEERTAHLQKLHDYAMDYADKYHEAQEELEALQQTIDADSVAKDNITKEQFAEAAKKMYAEKTKKMLKGFESDNVQYDDDEEEERNSVIKTSQKMGVEAVQNELMRKAQQNEEKRILSSNAKTNNTKALKIEREKIDQITPDIRLLAEKTEQDEKEKTLLLVIGEGVSKQNKIIKESGIDSATALRALNRLNSKSLIDMEEISYADISRAKIYYLTLAGKQVYKLITDQYPGEAECIKIKNRHKGYEHGYGIQAVLELLDKTGMYKSKTMFKNPIDLGNGTYFVPDIVAYLKDEYARGENTVDIFEYECMNQADLDYVAKLNKMALVSNEINIILNNATKHVDMQTIMYNWAQKRKNNPDYKNKYLRLSSYGRIKSKIKNNAPFDEWWFASGYLDDFPSPEDV